MLCQHHPMIWSCWRHWTLTPWCTLVFLTQHARSFLIICGMLVGTRWTKFLCWWWRRVDSDKETVICRIDETSTTINWCFTETSPTAAKRHPVLSAYRSCYSKHSSLLWIPWNTTELSQQRPRHGMKMKSEDYIRSKNFLQNLTVVNDLAESRVALI